MGSLKRTALCVNIVDLLPIPLNTPLAETKGTKERLLKDAAGERSHMASLTCKTPTTPEFENLLAKILQHIPTSTDPKQPDPRKQVETRLRKEWDEPKAKELEFCLRKRVSEEEARHFLFFPTEEQIEAYVTLICDPPAGAPSTHPQHVLQVPFISMLYLAHADNWKLCQMFIRAGGLRSLSSLIANKNIYLRSQGKFCNTQKKTIHYSPN